MTYFQKYLNDLEIDMAVYLCDDYDGMDYDEIDFEIKDILADELDVYPETITDVEKYREIFIAEIRNLLLIKYKAVEPDNTVEASLINPRVFKCRVLDQERFNDVLKNPELVLSM